MRKDILSVENITMQFGGVVAVNNLSLHIPEGQIVALIGPNGAGKTTAFNCITGVYEPTNGLVKFLDEPMVRNHPTGKMKKLYKGENPLLYTSQYDPGDETKEQMLLRDPLARTGKILSPTPDKITQLGIARTFQNIRLWKSMTVFENVLVAKHMRARQNVFSATFRGNAKEEKRMRDETMALLAEQGLEKYKDDIATSLPYGIQRRLEIARALATDPKVLLCDEATSALDPNTTHQILELIKDINKKLGITVVVITHQMSVVKEICSHVAILDNGVVEESGLVSAVFAAPKSAAARRLVFPGGIDELVSDPLAERKVRIIFQDSQTTGIPMVARLASEEGILCNVISATTQKLSEQVYGSMLLGIPSGQYKRALEVISGIGNIQIEEVDQNVQ